MSEALEIRPPTRLVLDDHALYARHTNEPVPASMLYSQLLSTSSERRMPVVRAPRLEDAEAAYAKRRIKLAGTILAKLTEGEPCYYSNTQNRTALNKLAHPIHKLLALRQYGGTAPDSLAKEIEAIHGDGADQLKFVIDEYQRTNGDAVGYRRNIEGGQSELIFFHLITRTLTGDGNDPYMVVPSMTSEDMGVIDETGVHHGFDFTVVRMSDGLRIPTQVKTNPTEKQYPATVLVVSIAELINDETIAPANLAQALYAEIASTGPYDEQLIASASERLFAKLDNFSPQAT